MAFESMTDRRASGARFVGGWLRRMLAHDARADALGASVGQEHLARLHDLLEAPQIIAHLLARLLAEQFCDERSGRAGGWIVRELDVNLRSAIAWSGHEADDA
jgi:hypothetical protein